MPVLAAGGIATGRALAAVLTAGADGAWMGTPLVATNEAVEVADAYKQKIVAARAEDSVFTRVFDLLDAKAWGAPPWPDPFAARVIRNETVDQWQDREADLAENIDAAADGSAAPRETAPLAPQLRQPLRRRPPIRPPPTSSARLPTPNASSQAPRRLLA
jgi:nitronate monooxygenase